MPRHKITPYQAMNPNRKTPNAGSMTGTRAAAPMIRNGTAASGSSPGTRSRALKGACMLNTPTSRSPAPSPSGATARAALRFDPGLQPPRSTPANSPSAAMCAAGLPSLWCMTRS
jgi:hypothetical protein